MTYYELTFIERIFHELTADSICFGLISYILSRLNWIRFAYPLVLLSLPCAGSGYLHNSVLFNMTIIDFLDVFCERYNNQGEKAKKHRNLNYN